MNHKSSNKGLIGRVLLAFIPGILGIGALFFLPAGTFNYWQAWLYLGILCLLTAVVGIYLFLKDPEALRRRLLRREREPSQKKIVNFSGLFLVAAFVLPGLDKRWGWSNVPVWVVLLADGLTILAFLLFLLVMRENSYGSRIITVEQGQTVIRTGPYAVVRHPMYVAMLIIYLAEPLALGSYWAILPALGMIPVFVARIRNEETLLKQDLPGYEAYCDEVKYRLLPGIW